MTNDRLNELETKILDLIGEDEYISVSNLEDEISIFELGYLISMHLHFNKIKIFDVDLNINNGYRFSDSKGTVIVPLFKIKRKELNENV